MREIYEKKQLELTFFNEDFKHWKKAQTTVNAYIEKYKSKAAIFLQVRNLLPSLFLSSDGKGFYYLILAKGENKYRNLGKIYVDKTGYGKLYSRLSVEDLNECDELLLISMGASEQIVFRWKLPFSNHDSTPKKSHWDVIFEEGCKGNAMDLFSPTIDETKATWYIVAFDDNKYKHLAIGVGKEGERYIGLPGRFLKDEEPTINEELLTLWQPLRGGEDFFENAEFMDESLANHIYGYWICRIMEDGNIRNL